MPDFCNKNRKTGIGLSLFWFFLRGEVGSTSTSIESVACLQWMRWWQGACFSVTWSELGQEIFLATARTVGRGGRVGPLSKSESVLTWGCWEDGERRRPPEALWLGAQVGLMVDSKPEQGLRRRCLGARLLQCWLCWICVGKRQGMLPSGRSGQWAPELERISGHQQDGERWWLSRSHGIYQLGRWSLPWESFQWNSIG